MHYLAHVILLGLTVSLANCWPDFYMFNSGNPARDRKITAPALKKILETTNCPCYSEFIFIIHGFTQDQNADWMHHMKDALLEKSKKRSVIIVDWKEGAFPINGSTTKSAFLGGVAGAIVGSIGGPIGTIVGGSAGAAGLGADQVYSTAARNVAENGRRIAAFIRGSGINPKIVHCIGHSLGAQSCGFTGKNVRLGRISGLDPAGPMFYNKPDNQRLFVTDADFVDILHTDSKRFGTASISGHVDFYPNGGANQPGCSGITCNHGAANIYYLDTIRDPYNKIYQAKLDEDYETFMSNYGKQTCAATACAQMGYAANEAKRIGDYYLKIYKKMQK